ncbi:MAG: IS110 family transposase [Thermoplasmata archaeon]|nr:MAG: IS110 family transposase [Thermoplasmata archaeon]
MLYAGLDVHKNFCQAIVMTKGGKVVKEDKIGTEQEDIEEFFYGLKNVRIAFEASMYYEYVYEILNGLGYEVSLSHSLKTRLIAESRIKTDKIDAKALADLLRADPLPTSYIPPEDIRKVRHLVRHRIFLGRHRTKLKNHIYSELNHRNLKFCGPDVFTRAGMKWLQGLNIPAINSYLVILDAVLNEVKSVELKIKIEGMKYDEVRLLSTIPGIGVYSALIILSEIGDINRFSSEEKLYSYAGMIPRVHQSGDSSYQGRITKEGSKHLRWILVEALRIHIQCAPDSKVTRYYYRLKKKKPGNVATMAGARKLLQVIYHMLKNQDEYRG